MNGLYLRFMAGIFCGIILISDQSLYGLVLSGSLLVASFLSLGHLQGLEKRNVERAKEEEDKYEGWV